MRGTVCLLGVLGFCGLLGLAGCSPDPIAVQATSSAANPRAALDSVRDTLRVERPTITTYRSAVQQLNSYLDQVPTELRGPQRPPEEVQRLKALAPGIAEEELRTALLSAEEVQRLRDLLPPSSKDEDIKAIFGRNFTILDAYHLDGCFLFRDAAQSLRQHLGGEPLDLATEAFAWTNRYVDLQPRPRGVGDWPTHEVLRRGTGEAEERLRVFLALLAQLEIEGGVLTRDVVTTDRERNTVRRQVPWLAAVLHQGNLYLYDPVAGQPVWKDSARKTVATWREVTAQPELLQRHLQGRTDLTFAKELLNGNQLWLEVSLTALAPRMKWLQEQLTRDVTGGDLAVRLSQDWTARLRGYEAAKLGLPVKAWARPDRPGYPIRLLAEYVQEAQRGDLGRQTTLRPADVVTPWEHLPDWLRNDRRQSGLYYALMSPQARQDMQDGGRLTESDVQRRLMAPYQNMFVGVRLSPGGHRDLLVRGKPERVVQRILKTEDEIDRTLHQLHTQLDPEPDLRDRWGPELAAKEQQFLLKREEYLRKKQENAPEAATLEVELRNLGREREKVWTGKDITLRQLGVEWGQGELREHLTYYMALAKAELALRAEWQQRRRTAPPAGDAAGAVELSAREQWQSALFWFRRYEAMVLARGGGVWRNAVQRQIQECEAALARLPAPTKSNG